MKQWMSGSLMVGLFLACTANASDDRPGAGDTTRQWLELHKSGAQASPDERPLEGDVAKRNRERYLKSFERPIPAQFDTGSSQGAGR